MNAEKILSHLQGVRKSGRDAWMARCPAHDDRKASLSIKEKKDGTVLVHCFAGCGGLDVIQAVGLEWIDLASTPKQDDYACREKNRGPGYVLWREFTECFYEDLTVIQLGAAQLGLGFDLEYEDCRRIWKAAERMKQGLLYARGW